MTQDAPGKAVIALGFDEDSVGVHARARGGVWRCVGRARWEGDGFDAHVARLRAAALRAVGAPVAGSEAMPRAALWLPRDLVFATRLRIDAGRGAAEEAQAALEARFGADTGAFVWTLAATDADGFAGLAAVERRTIAEARAHARRLGFTPGAATLRPGPRDALDGFPEPPVFAEAQPVPVSPQGPPKWRSRRALALGGGVLALAALALWAAFEAATPQRAPAVDTPEATSKPLSALSADQSGPEVASATPAPPTPLVAAPKALTAPLDAPPPGPLSPAHAAIFPIMMGANEAPPVIADAAWARPNEAPVLRVALALPDLSVGPMERMRAAGGEPSAQALESPVALSGAPTAGAPAAADAPPRGVPAAAREREGRSPILLAQASGPPGAQAPIAAPPPPPRAAAKKQDIPSVAATASPAEAAPPPPPPRPTALAMRAQPKASALAAPRPKPRPTPPLDAKTVARASVAVGSQSRAAGIAARQATLRAALRFDETALIGVFGGPDGRAALVRLASGEMRKVAMGSQIDGWTVSDIGETTLGLRKGGQTRRLSLPSE